MRIIHSQRPHLSSIEEGEDSVTKAIRAFFAGLLFVVAIGASAQDSVRVQVPFDFQASGKTLRADTYTITRLFDNNALLKIAGSKGDFALVLVGSQSSVIPGAGLSFHQYGDSHYLSAITTTTGKYRVSTTRAERETAAKLPAGDVVLGSK